MHRRTLLTLAQRLPVAVVLITGALASVGPSAVVATPASALVTVGSPATLFPRNQQNEPAIAVDPVHPQILAAGANDAIDLPPCQGNICITSASGPPVVSGIYFSFDGAGSWTQPTYTGFSSRTGTLQSAGPTGTVPWYSEAGLTTDGDPSLAFGPVPGPDGSFSWANGSRLYYSTIAADPSFARNVGKEGAVKGFTAIAASHTDSPQTAALGGTTGKNAWSHPVFVSNRPNSTTFADKEQVWADNAASSPFFGNVYACWVSFQSTQHTSKATPMPLMFSRSTDGGDSWSAQHQLTPAVNNISPHAPGGRESCTVRTDSIGTVYVFIQSFLAGRSLAPTQLMTRSFDGGLSFERPQPVANVVQVGAFDVFQSYAFYDGVRGARVIGGFPSVDIANGAPTGSGATNEIVLVWPDARNGLSHEEALLQYSLDGGNTWSTPVNAAEPTDRPDMPAVAISPNGQDVYLTYDGFLDPYRYNTSDTRRMQGVIRHADVSANGVVGGFATLTRGTVGDARASSDFFLRFEFLGDYNSIVATNTGSVGVWTDMRNAELCPAINAWRQSLLTNPPNAPPPAPAPPTDCPSTFGNSDVFSGAVTDPTP